VIASDKAVCNPTIVEQGFSPHQEAMKSLTQFML